MDTGKTIKIWKDIPEAIPAEIPSRKITEDGTTGEPIPVEDWPVRKEEEVEAE